METLEELKQLAELVKKYRHEEQRIKKQLVKLLARGEITSGEYQTFLQEMSNDNSSEQLK